MITSSIIGDPKVMQKLAAELGAKKLTRTFKTAYRREAKKVVEIVGSHIAAASDLNGHPLGGDAARLAKSLRIRIYPKGGGFMVSVKPRGKQGFYTNRRGKDKPVLMWASEGTHGRYTRNGGHYRGYMGNYRFMEASLQEAQELVEQDVTKELDAALARAAAKLGF